MELDPLDLKQSFGGQIALTAMGADHDRNILDDQERRPFPVAPGHVADLSFIVTADITDHG
jgi:hypothetical protein